MASFKAKFPVLQELFAKNHRGGALWAPTLMENDPNDYKYLLLGKAMRTIMPFGETTSHFIAFKATFASQK